MTMDQGHGWRSIGEARVEGSYRCGGVRRVTLFASACGMTSVGVWRVLGLGGEIHLLRLARTLPDQKDDTSDDQD
jgi:hypothetical protein